MDYERIVFRDDIPIREIRFGYPTNKAVSRPSPLSRRKSTRDTGFAARGYRKISSNLMIFNCKSCVMYVIRGPLPFVASSRSVYAEQAFLQQSARSPNERFSQKYV